MLAFILHIKVLASSLQLIKPCIEYLNLYVLINLYFSNFLSAGETPLVNTSQEDDFSNVRKSVDYFINKGVNFTSSNLILPRSNNQFYTYIYCFVQLMGLEKCGDKDEECHRRRMVAEAHLDYIYTQHQKP